MVNKFYTSFDIERLKESSLDEYRTPFQVDRDRIIHSSEFRRLQGKTQVFLPGEYDYYRTRLTHSIEVSQIGRSICKYLKKKEDTILGDDYFIDSDLVEFACLSHDLGNPPFGHPGEFKINDLMFPYGGYEGNAQTLRLISETFYKMENTRRGMNPTRASIDSLLKYKAFHSQFEKPKHHFIYDSQKQFIDFVFGERDIPDALKDPEKMNDFKSIECQIMDWADDTAYSINDLADGMSCGFINGDKVEYWASQNEGSFSPQQKKYLEELIHWIRSGSYKRKFSAQIGEFISACSLEKRNTFLDDVTNRYKYKMNIAPDVIEKVKLYKRISVELVFKTAQLHQIEFKGNGILEKVFNVLIKNYIDENGRVSLLPDFTDKLLRATPGAQDKARIICDYISGMTDSYALRIYKRLFDPDYSSIADLL